MKADELEYKGQYKTSDGRKAVCLGNIIAIYATEENSNMFMGIDGTEVQCEIVYTTISTTDLVFEKWM
jgi:hypothetical protein